MAGYNSAGSPALHGSLLVEICRHDIVQASLLASATCLDTNCVTSRMIRKHAHPNSFSSADCVMFKSRSITWLHGKLRGGAGLGHTLAQDDLGRCGDS